MGKRKKVTLVGIKVTEETVKNLNIASAMSEKPQYEMSLEGSQFVLGKYMSKKKAK